MRISFYKILILSFFISVGVMSTYLLVSINGIEYNNGNDDTIKFIQTQETNGIEDIFKPQKKLVVLEREVIKEVIKEVCANEIIKNPNKNNENNQEIHGFKDKESMINYFLTYQYYYNIEKYKDITYINTKKYNISKYSIPELVQKRSNFTPTIEESNKKIESIRAKYQNQQQYQQQEQQQLQQQLHRQQFNNGINQPRTTLKGDMNNQQNEVIQNGINGLVNKGSPVGRVSLPPNGQQQQQQKQQNVLNGQSTTTSTYFNEMAFNSNVEHLKYAKLQFRARVWTDFYSNYWRDRNFIEFLENKGMVPFQPPKPLLPLDTSKPLLSKPYLFLHIAKSGGSSMYFHFNSFFGSGVLQQWFHPKPNEYEKVRNSKNVVLGHYEYGIHYILDEDVQKTCNYLTMLRDPVDRVISHYFYHLLDKGDPEHSGTINKTLEDWIISSSRGNNEMTRVLSGISKEEEFKPSNETFVMALYHLRSIKFVGITERYTETLALLKFYTGLDNPRSKSKKNVGKPGRTHVSPEVIEKIKERNWMDILLYEEALKMFERQIDIVGRDNFEKQLNKIKNNI
ncbi:hypothetical protein ACTFIU_010869 [Dictyostelium citrinum]